MNSFLRIFVRIFLVYVVILIGTAVFADKYVGEVAAGLGIFMIVMFFYAIYRAWRMISGHPVDDREEIQTRKQVKTIAVTTGRMNSLDTITRGGMQILRHEVEIIYYAEGKKTTAWMDLGPLPPNEALTKEGVQVEILYDQAHPSKIELVRFLEE